MQNFFLLPASHILSSLLFITNFRNFLPCIDSKLGENVIYWIFSFGFTFEKTPFYSLIDYNRKSKYQYYSRGFPGGAVVENPPASTGNTGSIPGPARSHMPRSN